MVPTVAATESNPGEDDEASYRTSWNGSVLFRLWRHGRNKRFHLGRDDFGSVMQRMQDHPRKHARREIRFFVMTQSKSLDGTRHAAASRWFLLAIQFGPRYNSLD